MLLRQLSDPDACLLDPGDKIRYICESPEQSIKDLIQSFRAMGDVTVEENWNILYEHISDNVRSSVALCCKMRAVINNEVWYMPPPDAASSLSGSITSAVTRATTPILHYSTTATQRTPPKAYDEFLKSISSNTLFKRALEVRGRAELEHLICLVLLTSIYNFVKPLRYVSYHNGVETPNDALQVFMGFFFVFMIAIGLTVRTLSISLVGGKVGFYLILAFMCYVYFLLALTGQATYRGFNNERVSSTSSSRSSTSPQRRSSFRIRRPIKWIWRPIKWLLKCPLWLIVSEDEEGNPANSPSSKSVAEFRKLENGLRKSLRELDKVRASLKRPKEPGLATTAYDGWVESLTSFAKNHIHECTMLLNELSSNMEGLLVDESAFIADLIGTPLFVHEACGALAKLCSRRVDLRDKLLALSLHCSEGGSKLSKRSRELKSVYHDVSHRPESIADISKGLEGTHDSLSSLSENFAMPHHKRPGSGPMSPPPRLQEQAVFHRLEEIADKFAMSIEKSEQITSELSAYGGDFKRQVAELSTTLVGLNAHLKRMGMDLTAQAAGADMLTGMVRRFDELPTKFDNLNEKAEQIMYKLSAHEGDMDSHTAALYAAVAGLSAQLRRTPSQQSQNSR